jgi:hypothetical protein
LIAEEQHAVPEQRAMDLPDVAVGRCPQVDALYDGAERPGEGLDVETGQGSYAVVAGIACAHTI